MYVCTYMHPTYIPTACCAAACVHRLWWLDVSVGAKNFFLASSCIVHARPMLYVSLAPLVLILARVLSLWVVSLLTSTVVTIVYCLLLCPPSVVS